MEYAKRELSRQFWKPSAFAHSFSFHRGNRKGTEPVAEQFRVVYFALQLFPTQQLVLADDADGACVVAAVQSRIVCLLPVPLEEQVRNQLRGKRYEQAMALACSAVALNGMPRSWLETVRPVHALSRTVFQLGLSSGSHTPSVIGAGEEEQVRVQAGYLMLFDLEFERAVDYLLMCKTFQPAELFAFFPEYTRKWLRWAGGWVCVW